MKFYEKLQKLRKEKGYSQENLADILNVSRQAVSKWESGASYPETEKLIEISRLFNTSIDNLLKDEEISVENIKIDQNEEQEYLNFTKKFGIAISIGVDLCILSALLIIINIPLYISVLPILPAVILFIYYGLAFENYSNFKIQYINNKKIDKNVQKEFRKKFGLAISSGVSIILIGLIITLAFNYKIEYLFISILIAVPLFIYFGIISENYKLSNIDYHQAQKNEMLIGKISGIIMISATIIFLVSGLIYDAWHPMWIVYPIGGMICGIVGIIFGES